MAIQALELATVARRFRAVRPERDYVWNKTAPGDVGSDGHQAIDALLANALLPSEHQGSVLRSVSHWLQRMGMAEQLSVRAVGRSGRYELLVHHDGVVANLRDVGVGVSQVLPVLAVAYCAPPGSTVLLEEPEIHLHPLAQAVLAEVFAEVSQQRQVQFLVETHSEHLFRRMQTLIARRQTSTAQCRMLFVERRGADAVLVPLDWILIYGKFGFPALGAEGAGIANALALWLQLLAFAAYLKFGKRFRHLDLFARMEWPDWHALKHLLWIGVPMAVTLLMEAGLFVISALLISRLGTVAIDGHQIAINVSALCFMVPMGVAEATTVRVGHAVGSGDVAGIRRAAHAGYVIVLATQAMSALFLLLSGVCDGVSVVVRSTIMQLTTPDEMRGRVSSINSIFISSSNELGAFYAGSMARLLGLAHAVVLGGCVTRGVVAFTALKSPTVRRLELRELH